jgi:hypothetical protein
MVDLAIRLIEVYRPLRIDDPYREDLARQISRMFEGDEYPRGGYSNERRLNDWGELVLACDAGRAQGYGLEPSDFFDDAVDNNIPGLGREADEAEAVHMAEAFRSQLVERLRRR